MQQKYSHRLLTAQWNRDRMQSLVKTNLFPVVMTERLHLFPSRTQKLSPCTPTILGWRRPGKIGSCRIPKKRTVRLDCSFLCHSVVLYLPRPRATKLAGDGAEAERPLCGMQRSGCPVNKGALQAAAPQGDYCELRTYWVLARISVAQCERYGRISCR